MLSPTMLTVKSNRSQIWLSPIKQSQKNKIMEMADHLLLVLSESLFKRRADVEIALKDYPLHSKNRKIFTALCHLLEKKSTYAIANENGKAIEFLSSDESMVDFAAFRLALFKYTPKYANDLETNEIFARFIEENEFHLSSGAHIHLNMLYADLKENWRLTKFPKCNSEQLFFEYERGRVQAILLRSKSLRVIFEKPNRLHLRYIFNQLKFRELLFTMSYPENEKDIVEISLDGPFSLFEARTKYALRLALAFPLFLGCKQLKIQAEIQWKKGSKVQVFDWSDTEFLQKIIELPDLDMSLSEQESTLLCNELNALQADFKVELNQDILFQAGFDVVIPELKIIGDKGSVLYIELFQKSGRSSLIRRIDMIEKGFKAKLLLLYPEKCKVSENIITQEYRSSLYQYKRKIHSKSVEKLINKTIKYIK